MRERPRGPLPDRPARRVRVPRAPVPDRSLTPHELHQKAISVLDQLERIAAGWQAGTIPAADEIDVVTRSAVDLRRAIEGARERMPDAGPTALHHLAAARLRVLEAIRIVCALADDHPDRVSALPREGYGSPRTGD